MQLALFGDAVDRFFLTLEEPPEALEMVCTEELYAVAVKSRLNVADDHELYDYQPPQEAMSKPRPPMIIKTMGYDDGYEGRFPRERDPRYLEEHAWGRQQRASEHPDNTSIIFESPNQCNFARRGRAGT
jgi:hypothetical protein